MKRAWAGRRPGWHRWAICWVCIGAVAAALLLATGCGGTGRETAWVVALRPDKEADTMLEERRALQNFLERQLGERVEVIVPTSAVVIEQGLANGTIDAAWVSATSLAQYSARGSAKLLLVGTVNGERWYRSYWVSLADRDYGSIEDLRGRPVAFASPSSTSGYIVPVYDLYQRGLITAESGPAGFFGEGNVVFGTGYVTAVQRVLSGEVEAAAVSDYVMDGEKYLSAKDRSRLRVVQAQGPVPSHCLAVRRDLDERQRERLQAALLELGTSFPAVSERLFGSALVEADSDAHLESIRKALDFVQAMRGR